MKLKRFTVLSVSVLVLLFPLYKLVQACGGEIDPYDYYTQFFGPAVLQQPEFAPFHYTAQLKYYDEWYDFAEDAPIPDANIAAWTTYTKNTVPAADLDSFIYSYPYGALSSLYFFLEKGRPLAISSETESNAFTRWFKTTKDLEALGYLMYAKQCEPFVTNGGDWEMSPKDDTAKRARLVKSGLQLQAAAKQDFFKERYAYQVLRLVQYGEQHRQTLKLYTKLVGDAKWNGSEIFARCLSLKAGALFHLKRKAEAAYLYSRVFDLSDNLKRSSYLSFDWATTADVRPVLALCKSSHEKAVVHVMDGLNNYEQALPQIQAAYTADPTVRGLDVLFTREINKVEERYLQEDLMRKRNLSAFGWDNYEYDDKSNAASDKWLSYAATLNAFAQKAAAAGGAPSAYWQLSAAYLYFIQNDAANTKRWLDAANATAKSPREQDLHRIITTLYIIRNNGGMTAKAEAELLPSVQWLDERARDSKGMEKTYRDMLSTVIASAYLQGHDTVKAIFSLARARRGLEGELLVDEDFMDLPGTLLERISLEKLRDVQAFAGSSKSGWDMWLTSGTPYSASVLKELEGTKYLRQQQWGRAVETFAGVSKEVLNRRLLPDPFLARITDEMETDALDSGHMYTKADFARTMDSLSKDQGANALFYYGCGLYSMSYYGKANHAYTYYRSSGDVLAYFTSPQRKAQPLYAQDYYSANTAEQYFNKAAQKTGDVEFKAKCLWMAGKCWQKRSPLDKAKPKWELYDDKTYYLNSLKNPYFRQLGEPLASTAFMREAYSTCGYFRDYAKLARKK